MRWAHVPHRAFRDLFLLGEELEEGLEAAITGVHGTWLEFFVEPGQVGVQVVARNLPDVADATLFFQVIDQPANGKALQCNRPGTLVLGAQGEVERGERAADIEWSGRRHSGVSDGWSEDLEVG